MRCAFKVSHASVVPLLLSERGARARTWLGSCFTKLNPSTTMEMVQQQRGRMLSGVEGRKLCQECALGICEKHASESIYQPLAKYGVIENSPSANFALPRSLFLLHFFPLLAPWHGSGLRCRIACGACARNVRAKEIHSVFWRITKVELMSPMVL